MKTVSFLENSEPRLGFVVDADIVDPLAALGQDSGERRIFRDLRSFILSGAHGRTIAERLCERAEAAARRPLASAALAPPLMPSTILCTGSNYSDHNSEKANTPISGKEPEFFLKTSDSVIGPGGVVVCDPALTRKLDAETELAIVIGREGRHIPAERALEHVFGYTILNDVTARDRQVRRNEQGFTWYELGKAKAFDTSAPLGPCVVTADEIGDPQRLVLRTRINGELRQSSSTANMIWSCAQIIHFFSISFTLQPGMILSTGTPAGTAWSTDAELGGKWGGGVGHAGDVLVPANRYLLPGDVIESEIERIGVLRVSVG